MKLSKEQHKFLQEIGSHGIMFISSDMQNICQYLISEEYIEMIPLLLREPFSDDSPNTLRLNDAKIVVQITQKGKAYLDTHKRMKFEFNLATLISFAALAVSVIGLFT